MILRGLLPLLLVWISLPALAAEIAISVTDASGKPLPNAVVSLQAAGKGAGGAPVPPSASPLVVDQIDETFVPYLQAVRIGGSVVFHNGDRVRHHVYSFSPVHTFEFVLAPGESSPPITLEKTGVVTVGCNIHDHMIAYLYVTDAPYAAVTDASGKAVFPGLKDGIYKATLFHPRQRAGSQSAEQDVSVANGVGALQYPLTLADDRKRARDSERLPY